MDKVIKEIQESQCESDTWHDEDIPLDLLDQTDGEGEKGERRGSKKRSSTFSLDFPTIGPPVSSEAREKVLPHDKSCK